MYIRRKRGLLAVNRLAALCGLRHPGRPQDLPPLQRALEREGARPHHNQVRLPARPAPLPLPARQRLPQLLRRRAARQPRQQRDHPLPGRRPHQQPGAQQVCREVLLLLLSF